ncbi:MAG TPA: hypothetical protein VGT05_03095 [Patescibacteria group bacterium]|nr:hypothetical protein [Patescibacteria group bacterium]
MKTQVKKARAILVSASILLNRTAFSFKKKAKHIFPAKKQTARQGRRKICQDGPRRSYPQLILLYSGRTGGRC